MSNQKKLGQYFTPVWAAELLFNKHFSHLSEKDLVWEPTCGPGNFLSAIPQHIPAVGSDIDPSLVEAATNNTSRQIYLGDFRTINFDRINEVTAILGNPPFELALFEQFMERCSGILPLGKKAGFILPAYFFQTSKTFVRFARKWDISQEILPRDLFKGLSKPIIWASFIRSNSPKLVGFYLHQELCDIDVLKNSVKEVLNNQIKRKSSVWKEVLIDVLKDSGGTAPLNEIYKKLEGKRPTINPFWKEQVRKVIQQEPFKRVAEGTYQLL